MEDYRSPRRTLHIALLRNFLLEAVIISVLVYFLLTKSYSQVSLFQLSLNINNLFMFDNLFSVGRLLSDKNCTVS